MKEILLAWSAITFKEISVSLSLPYSLLATLLAYSMIGNIKSVSKLDGLFCNTEARRSRPQPVSMFLCTSGLYFPSSVRSN